MKNKKLTYFLIVLLVFIWGLIFYKIFVGVFDGSNNYVIANIQKKPVKDIIITSDTFTIKANYRDPFLAQTYSNVAKKTKKKIVTKPVIKKPIEAVLPIRWPVIKYLGSIKNQKTNKEVAMININRKEKLISVGDTVTGIRLLKIYGDSVQVVYEKEKKVIKKE
ncbi:MAG: hypothetical protein FVQ77_10360 [Cytophagales bacterium]|nr:hypothetical protein [Cytophagales bacterium]